MPNIVGSGFAGGVEEVVLEDHEDGCGGEVSDFAEAAPGGFEGSGGKAEGGFHGFEDLGASAMEDVAGDVGLGEVVVGEEGLDVVEEVFVDDFGDVGGEDDFEAEVADGPAHDVFGVAVEGGAGGEDFGAGMGGLGEFGFGTGDEDGCGSVGEEASGDEVGDGLVVVLPGEGAEFDGEEEGYLFGEGLDVVGGACDSGGSGDAAEAEDGGALDVDGEGHAVDEAGVDGGAGDSGDGGEEDGRDVGCRDAGFIEGAGDGEFAELDGGFDPGVVIGAEAFEGGVYVEGEDEVAEFDSAVGVEAGEEAGFGEFIAPAFYEGLGDFGLRIAVGRVGRADGGDLHWILLIESWKRLAFV